MNNSSPDNASREFRVWTHNDLPPLVVEAASKADAIALAVGLRAGAMLPGNWYGLNDSYIPPRPATAIKPYCRIIPTQAMQARSACYSRRFA